MRKNIVRFKKSLVFSVLMTIICFILLVTNSIKPIDNFVSDEVYQSAKTINTDIKIIAIDDASLEKYGAYNTWGRDKFANLVNKLSQDPNKKPAVIGLDILFSGTTNDADDLALANACKNSGNVVVGSNVLFNDLIIQNNGSTYKETEAKVSNPYTELSKYVKTGFVNTITDSDNYVRQCVMNIDMDDVKLDSFAYTIYKEYADFNGLDVNTYKENQAYSFDYSSIPGKSYSVISFSDILDGDVPDDFYGSIVLVGAYATGLMDDFLVPISRGTKMNGVEVHANIIEAISNNYTRLSVNYIAIYIIYLIFIFSVSMVMYNYSLIIASIVAPASIFLLLLISLLFRVCKFNFYIMLPVLLIIAGYVFLIVLKYIVERRNKNKLIKVFKKYISPEIVETLSKKEDISVSLGGEKKSIACMFVDIRGFTKMSEELTPEDVVKVLNEYLGMATSMVFKNGGMLDKYIGDAVMAVFNAPFDLDDYIYKSVKCALDIKESGKEIQEKIFEQTGKTIAYGIGVHMGEAIIGNIGCDFRMDYTAIGDTVNTASRLESNALGGQILVSEDIYNALNDRFNFNLVGGKKFKNKAEEIMCYEVLSERMEKDE